MINSKSPKFVEKLQQSLSLFLSLGHSRTTREVWSSKKKLTTKRRWSIQAAFCLWTNDGPQTPIKTKTKTKTLPIFLVLSPYSSLIPKLPNSTPRCNAAPSRACKWCDHWFLWWLSITHHWDPNKKVTQVIACANKEKRKKEIWPFSHEQLLPTNLVTHEINLKIFSH